MLGYGFVPTYVKGEKGKYQLVVSEKSWKIDERKLKIITRKTTPMTFDERIQKLKEIQPGWLNYFRMASIQGKLKELDGWVRNRLGIAYGITGKNPKGKGKTLFDLVLTRNRPMHGVDQEWEDGQLPKVQFL